MLELWELANFKPEYQFVVRQYATGKGRSVGVMWRGGAVGTIFGFNDLTKRIRLPLSFPGCKEISQALG